MKVRTSEKGIALIISFEGFSSKACKCVSTEKYYTIGYGHYGKDVKATDTITKEKAIELLKSDLSKFEKKVMKYNSVYHYNQNEFDALVSFAYNVGSIDGLTKNGTRTRKEITKCWTLYTKSGGRVLAGLVKRRDKEKKLFLTKCENEKSVYYPRYNGNSSNIDIVLKSIGVHDKYLGSWTRRKPIAYANNMVNYTGSLFDNIAIMQLAKRGKLKKP